MYEKEAESPGSCILQPSELSLFAEETILNPINRESVQKAELPVSEENRQLRKRDPSAAGLIWT